MYGDSNNKKSLTWDGSPLRKDVNFPPHQSHAENQLQYFFLHKIFSLTPLIPLMCHIQLAEEEINMMESSYVERIYFVVLFRDNYHLI